MTPSLYIHIPFCKRKCLYCDFYSVVYDGARAAEYVDTICARIKELPERFETIYIGGGTPTALPATLLERLLKSLSRNISSSTEFTVEANPESFDREKARILRDCGVNRLSIGIQSLDDKKLKKLGRIHDARASADAVHIAAKEGFHNISGDLIFGVWGEEASGLEKEIGEYTRLPLTHISAYSLTYEKGTPLFEALRHKSIEPLEDTVVAGMYETVIEKLSLRGFKQYEISNFAKEGFRCRHNLNYWDNGGYIGIGAAAVSYESGVRSKNVSDIVEYVDLYNACKSVIESSETLSPARRAKETAAVKIRTKDGIDFVWFQEKTGFDFMKLEGKSIPGLIEQGLIKYKKDGAIPTGICLKRKGFLFCDTVSSALL